MIWLSSSSVLFTVILLWLFVTFPQSILPEPNDCIFVIRSMMRFEDAPFRSRYGLTIVQGSKRVYEPHVRKKGGVI